MQKCSIILTILVLISMMITVEALSDDIVQFKQPFFLSVESVLKIDTVWLGVNSGDGYIPESSYMPDVGTEMGDPGQWMELGYLEPKSFAFRSQETEVPGHTGVWPPLFTLRPYDFRDYRSSDQVDTFQILIKTGDQLGDGLPESGLTFSWLTTLSENATKWQLLRMTKTSPLTHTIVIDDMAAYEGTSYTDEGAGGKSMVYYLIIKTGAKVPPVPVEMTSFTASAEGLNAELRWRTATEVNNYGYEVERRAIPNGIWGKIGFVAGAGTSNKPCEYTYTDKNLEAGKYTYRIKQVDNDGTFKYSFSVEIQVLGMPKVFTLSESYPNPFNPTTTIQFTVPQNGHVRLRIYNLIGQEVANLFDGPAEVGNLYKVKFDASSMSSGLYFSVLEFGNQRLARKMVLTK